MSLTNYLVYGIKIGCPEDEPIEWLGDKDCYELNKDIPGEVEIHSAYCYDFPHFTLIACDSEKRSWDLNPIDVNEHLGQFDKDKMASWDTELKSACEFLGMEYKQPSWQAIAQYF